MEKLYKNIFYNHIIYNASWRSKKIQFRTTER